MIKFIKLNKVCENGNYDIFVNIEHIVSFAKGHSNGGTYVSLVNLDRIEVLESEDDILNKIHAFNSVHIITKRI